MKDTQWTALDVERFREQQRWRLRQKTIAAYQDHQQEFQFPTPTILNTSNNCTDDRPRKVSLKFRREHEHFVSMHDQSQSPHASAVAVTMRPAFSIALPSSCSGSRRTAESPLPHMSHSLFNAFDSTASPEAFSLEEPSNQDEHRQMDLRNPTTIDLNEDQDMGSEDDQHRSAEQHQLGSLWHRRFLVLGMDKRSPKLGRAALWEATGVLAGKDACCNQPIEIVRVPLPFADEDTDEL
jgi:hypothetical protein